MTARRPRNRRFPRGFTMVEILIACALFALFVVGLVNFSMRGQESTKQLLDKSDNLRDTRLTLAFLEKDIREAQGITQFLEDDSLISFTLKHVKEVKEGEAVDADYITYNFIKTKTTIDGRELAPGSLTRGVVTEPPAEGHKTAAKILIHSKVDNRTNDIIGLIPKGEKKLPDGTVIPFESRISLHDKGYDVAYFDREGTTPEQREQMEILHTYKAKKNAIEGYTDVKETVALRLRFAMGDGNNKNIEFFHTVAYMRCMMLGNKAN